MLDTLRNSISILVRTGACCGALVACSSDCSNLSRPCPLPEAVRLSVSAANAPSGIDGLSVAVTGTVQGDASCQPGPVTVCHVLGPFGQYHLTISAPGYQTQQLQVTVNAAPVKCNVCSVGEVEDRTVVLQPIA